MSDMTPTVSDARHIRRVMREAIVTIRKYETDKAYAEYCEGIYEACRKALELIAGED